MMRDTTADLEIIKARLAAATPGPWSEFAESGDWWISQNDGDYPNPSNIDGGFVCSSVNMTDANIELVTQAPVDLTHLIAEVEQLRADVARLTELLRMQPRVTFEL